MKIAVSACLLGIPCRYDGQGKRCEAVCALAREHELIPVCPEQLSGLPTPRTPCELKDGKVYSRMHEDLTETFQKGAFSALSIVLSAGAEKAILKENSPSCGVNTIYDGMFRGTKISGSGIFASLLRENGIPVYSEEEL